MPSLRETQQVIAAALFDGMDAALYDILQGQLAPPELIAIYRNNLRAGFRKALRLDFPVVARLVGEDCFSGLALAYLREHPSRRGDLHHAGERFPDFLGQQFSNSGYAYLADVARLERARCEVLVAPEPRGLDLARLAAVAPVDYGAMRFALDASCRLVRSGFPLVRIWQANQPEVDEPECIDLDAGRADVLVCRDGDSVRMHVLTPAEGEFLAALDSGIALEAALTRAAGSDDEFELEAALRKLTLLQAINLGSRHSKDRT